MSLPSGGFSKNWNCQFKVEYQGGSHQQPEEAGGEVWHWLGPADGHPQGGRDGERPELPPPHDLPLLHQRAGPGLRGGHHWEATVTNRPSDGHWQCRQRQIQCGQDPSTDCDHLAWPHQAIPGKFDLCLFLYLFLYLCSYYCLYLYFHLCAKEFINHVSVRCDQWSTNWTPIPTLTCATTPQRLPWRASSNFQASSVQLMCWSILSKEFELEERIAITSPRFELLHQDSRFQTISINISRFPIIIGQLVPSHKTDSMSSSTQWINYSKWLLHSGYLRIAENWTSVQSIPVY